LQAQQLRKLQFKQILAVLQQIQVAINKDKFSVSHEPVLWVHLGDRSVS